MFVTRSRRTRREEFAAGFLINRLPPADEERPYGSQPNRRRKHSAMRLLCWLLLALCGYLVLGCAATMPGSPRHPVHPIAAPKSEALEVSRRLPEAARDRVHVFFLNGADPVNFCNFRGLAEYVQALGYRHVSYGQMSDSRRCEEMVRQLRRDDPQARIVLVGYSAGVYLVRDMAHALNRDRIPVDLLIYLGGDLLTNAKEDRPDNARRIVNIRGTGLFLLEGGRINGADLEGCENHYVGGVPHSGLPSDPRTLELVATALAQAAAK
jgi:hypothetical protein